MRPRTRAFAAAASSFILFGSLVAHSATQTASTSSGVETLTRRLALVGRVWVAVKFEHPRVALSDRDWDAVLDTTLPAVKAAPDENAFLDALDGMLKTIGDPDTRVLKPIDAPAASAGGESSSGGAAKAKPIPPIMTALPSGAFLIDVRAPGALADVTTMRRAITEHMDAIKAATRIVIDARGTERTGGRIGEQIFDMLDDLLSGEPVSLPASRYVRHDGYHPQLGGASFYTSQMVTDAASVQEPRAGIGPRRVAFVVDRDAYLSPIALALQARGTASVVTVGEPPTLPVSTDGISLGGGTWAQIRIRDSVIDGHRVEVWPNKTIPVGASDEAVEAAAAELTSASMTKPAARGDVDPGAVWRADKTYASEPFPSEPHRLLAVYRLWGVFENFFPYKQLTDKPWDTTLEEFIPRVMTATSELEYVQVMSEMAARSNDSHVGVNGSRAMNTFMGEAPVPAYVRYVEGKPIVTRVLDATAAGGLKVGDEIVSVDGEAAAARADRLGRYISYSTPAGRVRVIEGRLLNGAAGSTANVVVRGADGAERTAQARRLGAGDPQRDGDVVRLLPGNVGYADLERLEVADVPAMFEKFRDTVGIIFDMRGYPRGTAWAIAPRINTRKPPFVAIFERPIMMAGSTNERITFTQPIPPASGWIYTKPTAMLIDERAISQSEHTGLFFKAANGTTFVGSGTTGANGDVTTMTLPGGLRVSFTGHDVRWPDGHPLQRVGLVPDVPVTPTIAGIRAGRDEVLEKAIDVIKSRRGRLSRGVQ